LEAREERGSGWGMPALLLAGAAVALFFLARKPDAAPAPVAAAPTTAPPVLEQPAAAPAPTQPAELLELPAATPANTTTTTNAEPATAATPADQREVCAGEE